MLINRYINHRCCVNLMFLCEGLLRLGNIFKTVLNENCIKLSFRDFLFSDILHDFLILSKIPLSIIQHFFVILRPILKI